MIILKLHYKSPYASPTKSVYLSQASVKLAMILLPNAHGGKKYLESFSLYNISSKSCKDIYLDYSIYVVFILRMHIFSRYLVNSCKAIVVVSFIR